MNHYAILGIDESASVEQIKESYKNLSKRYHPNSTSSERSSEKFIELKSSYDFLIKNHRPKTASVKQSKKDKFEGEVFFRVLEVQILNNKPYAEIYFEMEEFELPSRIHLMMFDKEFTVTLKAKTKIPNTIEIFLPQSDYPLRLKILRGL